jgi:hypothetical protein
MEKMKVRDLMVLTDRFPKISDQEGCFNVVSALKTPRKNSGCIDFVLSLEDISRKIVQILHTQKMEMESDHE